MGPQEVDPYEILGLERGATWAEIRMAYRRLAKKHHPDKNPGDKASEWIFKEVGRAYERLRDVHGVHDPAGERMWRERDPGGPSDHERERQTREQQEREQQERAKRVRWEQERAERREREQWEKEQAQAAGERWEQAKSQRAGRASREGTGREGSGTRVVWPLVAVSAGLAVAALVGVTTTVYDRTSNALSDGAAQSVTEIEREAATAQSRGTAMAGQVPVAVVRGSTTPSGPSRSSVRVGPDVSPSGAARSATEVERGAATARPSGIDTARPASVPVGRSRAPDRASTTPSGAPRPSMHGSVVPRSSGGVATSPSDRSQPSLSPGANVSGSAVFTRGSHEDDVLRIQGTPSRIDRYPAAGYEIWKYGRSTVTISTRSRQVTEWSNPTGSLKVRLSPGANVSGSAVFTRGSHEDDVLRIQGTPSRIDRYPAAGYEIWKYGRSTVTISTRSRQVTEWSNPTGSLKVRLSPGANVSGSAVFTRGSHEDDVLRIQGTPSRIDRYPAAGYEIWKYGRSTVTISTRSRQVTEWSNPTGNLQVR